MSTPYDIIIVGAGSAGLTAAGFAIQLGVRVALVEAHRTGGDCTWTGCVPSKTLLKAAKVAHTMRTAERYGLTPGEPQVDLQAVMSRVREVVAGVYAEESPDALRDEGIDVYIGAAQFLDPHTLLAGGDTLAARHFVVATGARPLIPPLDGLADTPYLTYETIWDLEALPAHLLIIGGGPVGCEMAQAFRRLGAQVTLVTARDRLLSRDEAAASGVIETVFAEEGIDVRCGSRATRAWRDGDNVHLVAGDHEVVGDALLIAAGRRPNLDGLRLDRAGVDHTAAGIEVDDTLRTSQHHIHAAGDCIGSYQFTHYAGWQGFVAVRNALLPSASRGVPDSVPWTTFTDPEVARVGLTEEQAVDRYGGTVMTCDWPMARVDRARAEGQTLGFVKVIHGADGKVLGATIVAERAGEMIHEWIVALEQGIRVGDLGAILHVYPTYSTASMQAAVAVRIDQTLGGTSGRLLRGLARLMR